MMPRVRAPAPEADKRPLLSLRLMSNFSARNFSAHRIETYVPATEPSHFFPLNRIVLGLLHKPRQDIPGSA